MVVKVLEEFERVNFTANIAGTGAAKGPVAEEILADENKMMMANLNEAYFCQKEEIRRPYSIIKFKISVLTWS